MSASVPTTARELYLASLSPDEELAARRAAERAGIPDNDPTWLLLLEVRRATRETNRCTEALKQVVSDAVTRIGRTVTDSSTLSDAVSIQFANAAGARLAENDRLVNAVAAAVRGVEANATRAMHVLETSIRDFMRRRVVAPAASVLFAFSLGAVSAYLSIWGTYHVAIGYGQDLGYRAGFHDARVYDRSHP